MAQGIFLHRNAVHSVRFNVLISNGNASDVTMRFLLRTSTGYEHLKKKFKRAVLMHARRDSLEMAVFLKSFFVC